MELCILNLSINGRAIAQRLHRAKEFKEEEIPKNIVYEAIEPTKAEKFWGRVTFWLAPRATGETRHAK
jgi:hypothetical protein